MAMRRNVEKLCFAAVQGSATQQSSEGKAADALAGPAALRTLMQHLRNADAPPQVRMPEAPI